MFENERVLLQYKPTILCDPVDDNQNALCLILEQISSCAEGVVIIASDEDRNELILSVPEVSVGNLMQLEGIVSVETLESDD